jgi:hypothetical protein
MSTNRRNESHRSANSFSAARELYFDTIALEALDRAGECPQLKGVVHELLFRDKLNLSRKNLLEGSVTKLTKNPTAHGVDLVTLNKQGRPVAKYQLKDCTSPSGTSKTLGQVRNGKYQNAKLMGTEETTKNYNAAKLPTDKEMTSTGISSNRTGRIADNAGVKSPDASTVLNNFKDIGACAGTSALIGGGIAAGSSIYSGYSRYRDGEISGLEYAEEVVCETVKTAAITGGTTVAALSIKEGGKALGKSLGNESLKRIAGSNVATAVAFGIVEIGVDAVNLARGEMTTNEFARKATATTGGAAGGFGGATGGAALGTLIFPGVGTAIGGFIGALSGGLGGRAVFDSIGEWIFG